MRRSPTLLPSLLLITASACADRAPPSAPVTLVAAPLEPETIVFEDYLLGLMATAASGQPSLANAVNDISAAWLAHDHQLTLDRLATLLQNSGSTAPEALQLAARNLAVLVRDDHASEQGSHAQHDGWRLTFWDEFNGPNTSGIGTWSYPASCYTAEPWCTYRAGQFSGCNDNTLRSATPILPYQEDLLPDVKNLKPLNKCAWQVYDKYNGWDWDTYFSRYHPDMVRFGDVAAYDLDGTLATEHALILDSVYDATWADPNLDYRCGDELPSSGAPHWLEGHESRNCPIRTGGIMSQYPQEEATARPIGYVQTHGRFEIRALVPGARGAFPAHWLVAQAGGWEGSNGVKRHGEIDIMESSGNYAGTEVFGSFHRRVERSPNDPPAQPGDEDYVETSIGQHHSPGDDRFTTGWHVFAVEWEPDELRYYVDDLRIARYRNGQLVVSYDDHGNLSERALDLPQVPMFMILNSGVTNAGGLSMNDWPNLQDFVPFMHAIDYVRYYEGCQLGSTRDCTPRDRSTRVVTDDYGMTSAHDYAQDDQSAGPVLWSSALRELHTGDFDGDGRDDILLQNRAAQDHSSYLLRAVDHGDFADRRVVDTESGMNRTLWAADLRRLHVGDFDGDGDDDILLQGRSNTSDSTYLLLADGNGGFAPRQVVDNLYGMVRGFWTDDLRELHVGDFDGDGDDDILLRNRASKHVSSYLLRADGSGGFAPRQVVDNLYGMTVALWAADLRALHAGDFNGDGATDLLLQNRAPTGHSSYLLMANGSGGFVQRQVIDTQFGMNTALWAADHRTLHVGDFDGDGRHDLLLRNRATAGHSAYLLRAAASGGFNYRQVVDQAFGMNLVDWSGATHTAHVGDFTGDNRDDVLLRPAVAGLETWLLEGDGVTGFAARRKITRDQVLNSHHWSADHHGFVPGDFDGDGRVEAVLQADGTKNPFVLRQDATSTRACTGNGCPWYDTYVWFAP